MKLFDIFKKNKGKKRLAIIDIRDANFEQQVIRRSYITPVMVDFWASWCVPCRQLGPVLEKIAEDPTSDFILAKLNTEQNQRMAAKYNIRSIPAVKLFRNGQVVAEFTGVRPDSLVRRFIKKATDDAPPTSQKTGNMSSAKRLLQAEQHLKKGRGFEAFIMLDQFPDAPQAERASQLIPLARFLFDVENGDALTGIEKLDDAYLDIAQAMRKRKPARALDALFMALDVGEAMDQIYITAVIDSLFILLGKNHKLTQQYQPKLKELA